MRLQLSGLAFGFSARLGLYLFMKGLAAPEILQQNSLREVNAALRIGGILPS